MGLESLVSLGGPSEHSEPSEHGRLVIKLRVCASPCHFI